MSTPPTPATRSFPCGLIDHNLQLAAGWGSHIPSDGSGIDTGKPDPTNVPLESILDEPAGSRYFYIEGPALATAEWYVQRPVVPNLQPTLSFDLTPDPDDVNAALTETDLIVCYGGKKFNLSFQNYKGDLMVGQGSGGWADTKINIGPYAVGVKHSIVIAYAIDWKNNKASVLSMTLDGVTHSIPASVQNQAAVTTTWPNLIYFQLQKQLSVAGRCGVTLENINLAWS